MVKRIASVLIAFSLATGLVPVLAGPATAQVPPLPVPIPGAPPAPDLPDLPIPALPPLPALPAEAQPAANIAGPAVTPVCGVFGTGVVLLFLLAPAAGLPAGELFPVLLPVLQACSFLPTRQTRSKCQVDKDVEVQVTGVLAQAGQSLPVPPPSWPAGTVVDQAYAVDSAAHAYAGQNPNAGSTLGGQLSCSTEKLY